MEYAVFLLILACVCVGVVSAVVHTWSLRARLYSLEDRLAIVEGSLTREVKARAGQERWKKPDKDLELFKQLQQPVPQPKYNFWQTGLPRSVPMEQK